MKKLSAKVVALLWLLNCVIPAGAQTPLPQTVSPTSQPVGWPDGVPAAPVDALKPFIAFTFCPSSHLDHIYDMERISPQTSPLELALMSRRIPDGCHVLLATHITDGLIGQPEDCCRDANGKALSEQGIWPDHGIQVVAARTEAFMSAYAQAGGKCDLLCLDFEQNFGNWGMTPKRMADLIADPRFKDVAAKLAFRDLKDSDDLIERVCNLSKFAASGEYLKWNSVTCVMLDLDLNRAVGDPLWRRFPHAGLCNFASFPSTPENAAPDPNGHVQYLDGPCVGNIGAPCVYGTIGQLAKSKIPGDWKAPFTGVLLSVKLVRGSVRSSAMPLIPWVGGRSMTGDDALHPIPWANTDYWQENFFQTMLSGASNDVLFFNAAQPLRDVFAQAPADDQAMNSALAELEKQTRGHRLVKVILTDLPVFTAPFVAGAAKTDDGRIVARVSFAPGVDAADIKIEGKPFHVVCPTGKTGTWVEVP
jgi:hypothetical protein